MDQLLAKQSTLRADFSEQVSSWEKTLKDAIAITSFGENDIIKKVRTGILKDIKEINQILLYKEDLAQADRIRLIDKRSMYMSFVNLFRSAEITIDNLENTITAELDSLQK